MSENLWNQIVNDFRRACILRKQGRMEESNQLMKFDLPKTIALWSGNNPEDASAKKAKLGQAFKEEQQKIEESWCVHRALTETLTEEIVPALRGQILSEMNEVIASRLTLLQTQIEASALSQSRQEPRIKFDDIPGIVDALHEEERLCSRATRSGGSHFASQLTQNKNNSAEGVTGSLSAITRKEP